MPFDQNLANKMKSLNEKVGYYIIEYFSQDQVQKIRVVLAKIESVSYDLLKDNYQITVGYHHKGKHVSVSFKTNNLDFLKTKFIESYDDLQLMVKQNCLNGTLNNLYQSKESLMFKVENYKKLLLENERLLKEKDLEISKIETFKNLALNPKLTQKQKTTLDNHSIKLNDFIVNISE